MTETVPLGLAFVAGLVSFLSPCVFPIVPSYVGFVTGLTLDELRDGERSDARRQAAVHSALFVLGFGILFVALGASATALGGILRRSLPLLQQLGGVVIAGFGLYLLGVLKLPGLMRERRVHLASRPAGKLGSVLVGVAFGAGWTPCVGPVLASVLLYAGMAETMTRGMLLLAAYALGLGIPFWISATALNWFFAGSAKVRRWLVPLERAAGAAMLLIGALLFSGRFAAISSFLARSSPAIDLRRIGYARGRADAPLTVYEFSDFGCPFCGMFARGTYPGLHGEFVATGRVRWVYVPFVVGMFPNGEDAARAAECAAGQERFWPMHDLLFARQNEWKGSRRPAELFAGYAGQLRLDGARYASCYRENRGARRTLTNNRAADALGIRAAPSFLVGGRLVEGALAAEQFRQLLASATEGTP